MDIISYKLVNLSLLYAKNSIRRVKSPSAPLNEARSFQNISDFTEMDSSTYYLKGRIFQVRVGNSLSQQKQVLSGAPP